MAEYEWDPVKAAANSRKHGIEFADAVGVFEDERAITIADTTTEEERFKTLGSDFLGRLLVVAYTYRGRADPLDLRAKGNCDATQSVRQETTMKKAADDFAKGKRGAVVPAPTGKSRITIRIDDDVLEWFREQVNAAGGGNYQTMINTALREHIANRAVPLEKTLRRVIREELRKRGAA